MSKFALMYAVTAVTFLAVDFVWLAYVARNLYFSQIGHLMREQPNLAVAAIFYVAFAAGVVYFAVAPAVEQGSAMTALVNGALLGFLAYATYDVTNYSTLRDWPLMVSVIDTVWGTVLTAFAAWVGYVGTTALSGGS